ncbi:Similarity with glutathionylspermidine synthase [Pseudoalteromonas luteoviolacea B = ATCC 29581]|nr:Similarity with glutathionylspermidine synthase [Pseudoalteromonas luteoviolacea B = ATCC 29581]
MFRRKSTVRSDLDKQAQFYGFEFYNIDNEVYWDESAYYQLSLSQIENDLEDPSDELEQMCLSLVDEICKSELLLHKCRIPERFWDKIAQSWKHQDPSLYGRMDFSYNGKSHAKLLEYNADTPTSLYEAAFFQWKWLEQLVDRGLLPRQADQFNSIQERLIDFFSKRSKSKPMHFAYSKNSIEDKGTVMYLQDCGYQGGLATALIAIEDIGIDAVCQLTDLEDQPIQQLFKLYPWEQLFEDEFSSSINLSNTDFIEPIWKAILSNKAILPLLWERYPQHPNLLPAYFAGEEGVGLENGYVSKPLFGREGSNITLMHPTLGRIHQSGVYGSEGYITQAIAPLPKYADQYALFGVWLVDHKACGLTIREDNSPITTDAARFLPHIII